MEVKFLKLAQAEFDDAIAFQIIKVWLVERLKAEAANKPLNGDAASGAH